MSLILRYNTLDIIFLLENCAVILIPLIVLHELSMLNEFTLV